MNSRNLPNPRSTTSGRPVISGRSLFSSTNPSYSEDRCRVNSKICILPKIQKPKVCCIRIELEFLFSCLQKTNVFLWFQKTSDEKLAVYWSKCKSELSGVTRRRIALEEQLKLTQDLQLRQRRFSGPHRQQSTRQAPTQPDETTSYCLSSNTQQRQKGHQYLPAKFPTPPSSPGDSFSSSNSNSPLFPLTPPDSPIDLSSPLKQPPSPPSLDINVEDFVRATIEEENELVRLDTWRRNLLAKLPSSGGARNNPLTSSSQPSQRGCILYVFLRELANLRERILDVRNQEKTIIRSKFVVGRRPPNELDLNTCRMKLADILENYYCQLFKINNFLENTTNHLAGKNWKFYNTI